MLYKYYAVSNVKRFLSCFVFRSRLIKTKFIHKLVKQGSKIVYLFHIELLKTKIIAIFGIMLHFALIWVLKREYSIQSSKLYYKKMDYGNTKAKNADWV